MRDIFITYNQNADGEESTALRLQTISNLYSFSVSLPYRRVNDIITDETKHRIDKTELIVAFCLTNLTNTLKKEIEYAIGKRKPVIVIYDQNNGRKINFEKGNNNIKEVFVDFNYTDDALHQIAGFIRETIKSAPVKKTNNGSGLEIALIGIGLGLLAAWSLSKEN